MTQPRAVAASWDAEYAAGRYVAAAPDGFVTDIIAAATAHHPAPPTQPGPVVAMGSDLAALAGHADGSQVMSRRAVLRAASAVTAAAMPASTAIAAG